MRSCRVYFMTAALLLLLLMEMGCMVIPTKLPNRIHGFGAARLQKRDVDSTFITIGATRRDEVAARLAVIDTGSPTQFFWGRWAESSWGVVGGMVTDLDPSDVMGGSARHWHFHNLLVKFDDQGIAQEKLTIDNDDKLWQQLLAYSRHQPPAPMPEAMRIPSAEKKYTEIILAAESIQFRGAKPKDDMVLPFPSPAVIRLRPHFWNALERPVENCYTLEAESAGPAVKRKADFCVSGQQLAEIVAYLDRLPGPARWEEK